MASLAGTGGKSKKKRTRNFTPEDRASHRLIEKQRREALNESFLELARLVPELAQVRQLSKSIIVKKSIAHLRSVRAMNLAAAPEIQSLLTEYGTLLAEVNVWRSLNVQIPKPAINFTGGAIKDILNVEKEKFGTFPQGFDENRSNVQPVEAGDELINGFDNDNQHVSMRHNTNSGPDTDECEVAQPTATENAEPSMQMGLNDGQDMSYFVSDQGEFVFNDPGGSLFAMPTMEGQIPVHVPGFESDLFGFPGVMNSNATPHQSL